MVLEARSEGQPPNATQTPQEFSLQLAKAQPPKWKRRKRSLPLGTCQVSAHRRLGTGPFGLPSNTVGRSLREEITRPASNLLVEGSNTPLSLASE